MFKQSFMILVFLVWPGVARGESYVFSAPPAENRTDSNKIYQPLARFMSEVSGKNIVFKYSGNWVNYIRDMQNDSYDFVIDAPHFVSWRIEKIEHRPIISLSRELSYVVVVPDNARIRTLQQLQGKAVCSSNIPNIDALTILDQFASIWSQPSIRGVKGKSNIFQQMIDSQCSAAILPEKLYAALSVSGIFPATRILFKSYALPHYALSVSPRVNTDLADVITEALLSEDADDAFFEINQEFGLQHSSRIPVDGDIYRGYAYLLSEYWGF